MADLYEKESIYARLLREGYPQEDIDHHESDLYVYVTPLTTKIIKEYFPDHDHKTIMVNKFKDNVTGRYMYDITFAYDPYWAENGVIST